MLPVLRSLAATRRALDATGDDIPEGMRIGRERIHCGTPSVAEGQGWVVTATDGSEVYYRIVSFWHAAIADRQLIVARIRGEQRSLHACPVHLPPWQMVAGGCLELLG